MSNGNLMMLASPLTPNVDLSALGLSSSATIVDCLLEEIDRKGHLVWQWRASDHIYAGESTQQFNYTVDGQPVYEIFHCNSIDTDPISGNVLVSSRNTDAVYLIDKASGSIVWKMGGNSLAHSGVEKLAITDDPEGAFHAQHDARFEPNGDVSLFDDQSGHAGLAMRGVEYHIDTSAGIASLVWSYQSPDGSNTPATGVFSVSMEARTTVSAGAPSSSNYSPMLTLRAS